MSQIKWLIPGEIIDAIEAISERTGASRTGILQEALRQYLNIPRPEQTGTVLERLNNLERRVENLEKGSNKCQEQSKKK